MNASLPWYIAAGVAALVACLMARLLMSIAPSLGFIDHPADHKAHAHPTPLLGGVAVYVGALAGIFAFQFSGGHVACAAAVFLPSTLAAIGLGLLDDYLVLPPWPKLAGLLVIATVPPLAGMLSNSMSTSTAVVIGIAVLLSANSFNLLDNADGVCASVALVVLAAVGVIRGTVMAGACAAALAGFLVWNAPRARIFLGDGGSLLIGTWCALCAFMPGPGSERIFMWELLPLFVVPLCDTAFVIVVRIAEGRAIMQGGRDHLSHRLMCLGLPIGGVDLLLAAVTALGGLAAWRLMHW